MKTHHPSPPGDSLVLDVLLPDGSSHRLHIRHPDGIPLYTCKTWTDIASKLLEQEPEREKHYAGMLLSTGLDRDQVPLNAWILQRMIDRDPDDDLWTIILGDDLCRTFNLGPYFGRPDLLVLR